MPTKDKSQTTQALSELESQTPAMSEVPLQGADTVHGAPGGARRGHIRCLSMSPGPSSLAAAVPGL